MSVKKAIDLFKKLTVAGTDPDAAFDQASLKFAITRKRLVRAMRADLLSNAEKSISEFIARVPQISSETLQTRIGEFEKIVDGLDKEPESPLQLLRQAYSDVISAARNEIDRRNKG